MPDVLTRQLTKAEWARKNPRITNGEYGLERDTGKGKLGDGVSRWNQLPYSEYPTESSSGDNGGSDTGMIPDNRIPSSIARDTEVASAVSNALAALVNAAPASLDTLKELAAALGNDANFAASIATQLGQKYVKPDGGIPVSDLVSAQLTEYARDAAAALFTNGNHVGVGFVYNDEGERIDATVTASGGSSAPGTGRNPLTNMYHLSGYAGVDKTGATDQTALIQSVVNEINAAGGGVLWVDPGTYRVNGTIVWKNGVSLKGVHRSAVILKGYQVDNAVIRAIPGDGTSAVAPLRDCEFAGFKIDANNQTLSGSYTSAVKGIFIQHMRRVQFHDLWIDGTGASSIGVDFLYEACVVDNNLITNYGRLNTGNGPGSSGIGLGTASTTNIEAFSVTRNHVVGGAGSRFGIFVESQNEGGTNQFAQSTFGGRITDNYVQGGQWGIGDAGNRHLLISHNQITAATIAGITVNGGTFTQGRTGFYGEISDNQLWANKVGIHLDYSKVNTISYSGHYTVRDNHIGGSTDNGILVEARLVTLSALQIIGNVVHTSGKTGILFQYSGSSPSAVLDKCSIKDNVVYANGQTGTTGVNDGVRISVPLTDCDVSGNKAFDHQTTKTQRYGLVLTAAVTGGKISDNDFRGNLTGVVLLTGSSFANVQMGSNSGWNPPAYAAISVPASGANYAAPDYPTSMMITGGTVTAVTIGGVAAPTSGQLLLEPGDVVVFTYSAAPTVSSRSRA